MLGNTVSFMVSSSARYAPQLLSPPGASGIGTASGPRGITPLSRVDTGDAVGNILAIVANMKGSQALQSSELAHGSYGANVQAAVSAYLSENDHTPEDARAVLGRHMDRLTAQAPDSHKGIAEAHRNGTLKIERLWDLGVETSKKVMLQFDGNGRQVGSTFRYNSDAAVEFLEDRMGKPSGELGVWGTDKDTGRNATWMAIANNYFYITWE